MEKEKKPRKPRNSKITINLETTFTQTELSILAYFMRHNNKPTEYKEISLAYMHDSRSHYHNACKRLIRAGYLEKTEEGKFRVRDARWKDVKKGVINVERKIPYIPGHIKRLKEIEKRKLI